MPLPRNVAITAVQQPETGAVVLIHCPECRTSRIMLCEWAPKPKDGGDLWIVRCGCLHHNGFLPPTEFDVTTEEVKIQLTEASQ